ncbi:GntR family transcriptional regulator [Glutamicibacter sp. X7]
MSTIAIPMHQQVSDHMRQEIVSGRWSEGSMIPGEIQLSEQYGVSRSTIRQALASLRQEGLIRGVQGRRPIVCKAVPSQPFSVFMSFSEWASAMGRVPGQRTVEIARRSADAETADLLQVTEGDPVVQLLRVRSLDGAVTMLERSRYLREVGDLLFEMDLDAGSIYAYLRQRGVDLASGRHVIDAVAADAVDAEHLGVVAGSPLLRARRTAVDAQGKVLEVADDRYLPEQANFVIENHYSANTGMARVALVG